MINRSRKPYECFKCRDNGFPQTQVYLAGKDESWKTVYIEENGTPHVHKIKQQQQQQQQEPEFKDYGVSEESVQRGITAFSMVTNLTILVEQMQKQLVSRVTRTSNININSMK